MKVVAISDIHGQYNFTVPEADILCICGDIVPLHIQRNIPESMLWFKKEFIPWCLNQPVKKTFFIAGNHDFFLEQGDIETIEKYIDELAPNKIEYLENNSTIYSFEGKDYKIYGTPWCHIFGPWAFMISDEEMAKDFALIPEDTDILLTHDAPYGRTDLLLQSQWHMSKGHIGNYPLRERLNKISPKYNFTGHLHSCNHIPEEYNGTTTVCVSLLDENYNMTYKPFLIDI